MPTHTIHSSFTDFYTADPAHPGAPWDFPAWKRISGVTNGIFPEDDSLLPSGWTRETATAIQSYFTQYSEKKTEVAKIKFAASTKANAVVPGRSLWTKWFNSMWIKRGVASNISKIISDARLDPMSVKRFIAPNTLEKGWNCASYLNLVIDPVGEYLFGPQAMNPLGLLNIGYRARVQAIIIRTYESLRRQAIRAETSIDALEQKALQAFDSKFLFSPSLFFFCGRMEFTPCVLFPSPTPEFTLALLLPSITPL